MQHTYTFAGLDISPAAFNEIHDKLQRVGDLDSRTDHEGHIDMRGLAVRKDDSLAQALAIPAPAVLDAVSNLQLRAIAYGRHDNKENLSALLAAREEFVQAMGVLPEIETAITHVVKEVFPNATVARVSDEPGIWISESDRDSVSRLLQAFQSHFGPHRPDDDDQDEQDEWDRISAAIASLQPKDPL